MKIDERDYANRQIQRLGKTIDYENRPDREPIVRVFKGDHLDKSLTMEANKISKWVQQNLKLTYGDTDFYVVDLDSHCEAIAGGGWRATPAHWTVGQDAEIQKKGHTLGNWIVYEIVAGTGMWTKERMEPNDAFIYNVNTMTDFKLVVAHVYGHVHMDLNNIVSEKFKPYSPYGRFNFHKERYEELEAIVGTEEFEEMCDVAEILGTLMDFYPPTRGELNNLVNAHALNDSSNMLEDLLKTSEDKKQKLVEARNESGVRKDYAAITNYDVLSLVADASPVLKPWQREVLRMKAERNKYLYTTGLIKTVHEGFAAFVDLLYAMKNDLPIGETFEWIKHRTNGLLHPRQGINPYAIGLDIYSHIFMKWGSGEYGIDYELNPKASRRDLSLDLVNIDFEKGWDKVLEVAANNTDYTFFANYFDEAFFNEKGRRMFVYEENKSKWWWWHPEAQITSRQFDDIKNALLFRYYNMSMPRVGVAPGGVNYGGKGELYLKHDVEPVLKMGLEPRQVTLDPGNLSGVLKALHYAWGRPVHMETIDGTANFNAEKQEYVLGKILVTYDGAAVREKNLK